LRRILHGRIRAYNDGVAFRHVIPGNKESRIPDEDTRFVLPAGSTLWYHDLRGHYEAEYNPSRKR
jgi:alpha-glucosidase